MKLQTHIHRYALPHCCRLLLTFFFSHLAKQCFLYMFLLHLLNTTSSRNIAIQQFSCYYYYIFIEIPVINSNSMDTDQMHTFCGNWSGSALFAYYPFRGFPPKMCLLHFQAKQVETERTTKWVKMIKSWKKYFPSEKVFLVSDCTQWVIL